MSFILLSNAIAGAAKDHGQKYMKVRSLLVHLLKRNHLLTSIGASTYIISAKMGEISNFCMSSKSLAETAFEGLTAVAVCKKGAFQAHNDTHECKNVSTTSC